MLARGPARPAARLCYKPKLSPPSPRRADGIDIEARPPSPAVPDSSSPNTSGPLVVMESNEPVAEAAPSAMPLLHGVPGAPSPQFALLNYFFPGFSVFISAANAYIGTDVNLYIHSLIALCGAVVVWSYARSFVWNLVDEHLMSSVRIRTDDEIYNMVMLWLSKQKFSQTSRHFLANTNLNSRSRFMYRYNDSSDEDDDEDDNDEDEDGGGETVGETVGDANGHQKSALHYTPAFGSHYFWYRGYPLMFERHQNRQEVNLQSLSEREELSISCFGRSPWILKQLLVDARQMHLKKDKRKTLIYRGNLTETYWQRCMSRLNRPFATVILNEQAKRELLDDAADYLNPSTRRWYANRGIPYRRGYLLHGPPGTGKSSLSLALAGYFRMKIYIVSLSSASATEENITTLFNELPTRCIVLLEDIDSAGLTHTREDAAAPKAASTPPPPPPPALAGGGTAGPTPPAGGRLSLSGLLNILDGIASQEGRILVMTTNHIEKLDKALIRPGRVDMIIPFGLADAGMTAAIFRAIYAPYENEHALLHRPRRGKRSRAKDVCGHADEADQNDGVAERLRTRERVDGLAKRFAANIPELEFSPAEVQGLLLRHKREPERAIDAAALWVTQMRKERKAKEEELEDTSKRPKEQPMPSDAEGAKVEDGGAAKASPTAKESAAPEPKGTADSVEREKAAETPYETDEDTPPSSVDSPVVDSKADGIGSAKVLVSPSEAVSGTAADAATTD
ncbi:putative BCS1 protein precursor [Drechmeria coniospora]|uniref:Putative BCS1 protein n=1 Tax=Drechmeria coniospora TaxID=98403 RepID=A0A151GCQ7_DRECN|nr:putative BCS1 protein precursor [Drechmeria coniospora]KYK54892.1 putative BCS1 protein precursor [Drechmeria coniospora]